MDELDPSLVAPLHILIVEDMEMMAVALSHKVVKIREWFPQARVSIVTTFAAALEAVQMDPAPDGVFLDLSLPDSDLYQSIANVNLLESRSTVVIITGHAKERILGLLENKDIPILEKGAGIYTGDTILLAFAKRWLARKRSDADRRMADIERKLSQVREQLHGPQEEHDAQQ